MVLLKNPVHTASKKTGGAISQPLIEEKHKNKKTALIEAASSTQMTQSEAQDAINKIKDNMCSLMELCYLLEKRKGYFALGYSSFKECVKKELAGVINYDNAFKLKNAGQVHMSVCPQLPMGEISEGVLRVLHTVPEGKRKNIFNIAIKKCGDINKVKSSLLTAIIKSQDLAKPLKQGKENVEGNRYHPKSIKNKTILMNAKLQEKLCHKVYHLLKQDRVTHNHRPASFEIFEEALNIMLNEIFDYLCDNYENIYNK